MAKKNQTHKVKDTMKSEENNNRQEETHQAKAMSTTNGESVEKLESLKTLNARLLKETMEHREQMKSLREEKSDLEAELTRSGFERKALESDLKRMSEESESFEIEKSVFRVFVKAQMGVLGVEAEREKSEREEKVESLKKSVSELMGRLENEREMSDELKTKLGFRVEESNRLREKVVCLEGKERVFEEEIGKLKRECEKLMEAKAESAQESEDLSREKGFVEKKLEEAVREVESLKSQVERIAREKKDLENDNEGKKVRIDELAREVGKLNEIFSDLRKEEGILRATLLQFEKSCEEAMEREKEMEREICALKEEGEEKKRNIELVREEKLSIMTKLDLVTKELNGKEQLMRKMIREKNEIEELKANQEHEILELQKTVSSLRDSVSTLQELCRDEADKNKRLTGEVDKYRVALDVVTRERDDARNGLDEEKRIGSELRSRVLDMEVKVKETTEELEKISAEHENLVKSKTDVESNAEMLVKEKDMAQKNLIQAEKLIDELKTRIESANLNSESAFTMLKTIATFVNQSRDEGNGMGEIVLSEGKLARDLQPYAAELEAIKKEFITRETMVNEMKQQVESLQNSVGKEQKKTSFWTVVSSATTIVAAVSVAFAARGH